MAAVEAAPSIGVGGHFLGGLRFHGLGKQHHSAYEQQSRLLWMPPLGWPLWRLQQQVAVRLRSEGGWSRWDWPGHLGVLPAARSLHSALLLVALAAFPTGRLRRPWQFVVAILAIMVGLQLFDQLAIAASFAVCALGCALAWQKRRISTPYAALSAVGVSGVISTAWFMARFRPEQFRPSEALLAYEVVLVLIAVGFALAVRAAASRRAALEDQLVADAGPTGVLGLELVLRDVLHDPDLRIVTAGTQSDIPGARVLNVADNSIQVAQVVHRSSSLDDPATAAAVSAAIRLTLTQERRQAELAQRVADLEAARIRIVASADRQREQAAVTLRNDLDTLERTRADLDSMRAAATQDDAGAVFHVVCEEITSTTREIGDLVAGVPSTELGGGRLRAVLEQLAARCSLPASITIEADTAAGVNEETALYYVCMEALTNAVKHAEASSVEISLTRVGESIGDDGARRRCRRRRSKRFRPAGPGRPTRHMRWPAPGR